MKEFCDVSRSWGLGEWNMFCVKQNVSITVTLEWNTLIAVLCFVHKIVMKHMCSSMFCMFTPPLFHSQLETLAV